MALSTTASRVQYLGDGSTTVFTVTFEFFNNTDLKVYSTVIATGASTLLTLTTDYTLTGAGVGVGGTLTMLVAPANTVRITIARVVNLIQASVYNEDADFPVKVVEGDFDYSMMTLQQQADALSRSIQIPISDPTGTIINIPNSVERANKALTFDGAGNVSATVDGGYYRGNYVPGTQYFFRDLFSDQMTGDIYFVLTTYVAVSIAADISGGTISLLFSPADYAVGNPFNIAQFSVTTGSSNAYVISGLTNYTYNTAGAALTFQANFTNTGAATLNVNSLGATSIKGINGANLISGAIQSGSIYYVVFDGSVFKLINPSQPFGGGAYYLGPLSLPGGVDDSTYGQDFVATTSDGFSLTNGQEIKFSIPIRINTGATATGYSNKASTTLTINGTTTSLYDNKGNLLPAYTLLAGEVHSAIYDSGLDGLILLSKSANKVALLYNGVTNTEGAGATPYTVVWLTLTYSSLPTYSPVAAPFYTTTTFTCPRAGLYQVTAGIDARNTVGNLQIFHNGAVAAVGQLVTSAAAATLQYASNIFNLAVGDTIYITAVTLNGATGITGPTPERNYFSVVEL